MQSAQRFQLRYSRTDRSVSAAAVPKNALSRLQISYSTETSRINPQELAVLLSSCALDAPAPPKTPSAADSREPLSNAAHTPSNHFTTKVRRSLRHTLASVAAYVPEAVLAREKYRQRQHDGSLPLSDSWLEAVSDFLPAPGPRVLVGFARAIGDAALVSTIHDVAVLPELQGRGIGAALVERLTLQLYGMDIIDIGTVVPKSLEGFMVSCNFGDDSEESITMRLTPEGAQRYLQRGSGAEGSARERVSKLPPLVLEELETLISSK